MWEPPLVLSQAEVCRASSGTAGSMGLAPPASGVLDLSLPGRGRSVWPLSPPSVPGPGYRGQLALDLGDLAPRVALSEQLHRGQQGSQLLPHGLDRQLSVGTDVGLLGSGRACGGAQGGGRRRPWVGQGRSALPPLWWALGVPGGDGGRQPPEGPKPKAGPGGAGKGSGQPQRRGLGEDAYHQEAREAAGGAKRTVPCLGGWAAPPQRPSWPCRSRASPGCGLSRDLAVRVTLVKHTLVGDSLYLKHGVGGQLRVGTAGGESARPILFFNISALSLP